MKLAGKTDVGRVRQDNQDDYRAGELPGDAAWLLVCDGMGGARGGKVFLCHAGDSRAYLYRDGRLAQLTHDHSYVQELVDCGTITVEEAEHHPQKNIITKALGVDYRLDSEFTTAPLQKGDILLLCSDGLTNAVPREQLEQLLRTGRFYDLPDLLIRTANENGGPDNITALLLCVEEVR